MPVRTSVVVASGLGLLTMIGVGTIFGDSIAALVTPPAIEAPSTAGAAGPAAKQGSANTPFPSGPPRTAAPTAPAPRHPPADPPDGSS